MTKLPTWMIIFVPRKKLAAISKYDTKDISVENTK